MFYDNNVRGSEPTTKGADLQAAWYGDGWSLSGQVGQSEADNDLKQWFIEPAFTGGFSWDINRGITFDDPEAARDPANWVAEGFFGNHGIFETEAKDTYGQVDFSIEFDGMFNELVVGVRQHEHEEDFSLNVYGIPPVGDLSAGRNDRPHRYSGLCSGSWPAHLCRPRQRAQLGPGGPRRISPIRMRPASSTTLTASSRPTLRRMGS